MSLGLLQAERRGAKSVCITYYGTRDVHWRHVDTLVRGGAVARRRNRPEGRPHTVCD